MFPHNRMSAPVFTSPIWRAARTRPDKPWPCRSTRPVTRVTGRRTSLVAAWWASGKGCWSLYTPSITVRHVMCLSLYLYLLLLHMLTKVHEGHCEVHSLLPIVCDGEICYSNVCFLQQLQSGTVIQQFCTECSLSHAPNAHWIMVHQWTQIFITTNLVIHSSSDFPSHYLEQASSTNSLQAIYCPRRHLKSENVS